MALPRQNTVSPLLIRWSRVRISPDPPVHRELQQLSPFSFGLLEWVGIYSKQSDVYWAATSQDGERWWTDETISIS